MLRFMPLVALLALTLYAGTPSPARMVRGGRRRASDDGDADSDFTQWHERMVHGTR